MNFQKTYILGRVSHTPEHKALPNGTAVVTFSMATNRTYKDAAGAQQEDVEWHNCVAYGKTAEIIAKYVQGGQVLFIEGRNKTRSWDDKDGNGKRYRTEVIIERFQFGPKAQNRADSQETKDTTPSVEVGGYTGPVDTLDYDENNINIDDIPF